MLVTAMPFALGAGVASPAALTKSISVDPQRVGSASGLYGCGQMIVGAICTAVVGFGQGAAWVAGSVMLGCALLGQLGFLTALATERRLRK
jgi:DHA1 family bicyclomycin/chloramphenicol resistance-like MFS transporter